MSERVYPVKSEGTTQRMQEAYRAKLERNRTSGRQALMSGEYVPFRGHSREALSKTFEVSLELDESSKQEIQKRIVQPLTELAQKYGVVLASPGHGDVPSHITLEVGVFQGMAEEQATAAEDWLVSNRSHLKWLMDILSGLSFHLDTLVPGPTLYICASRFDAEQGAPFRTRKLVDSMMERAVKTDGVLAPKKYDDILHSVVGRITNHLPGSRLLEFVDEAERTIGRELKEHPIQVVVGEVSAGRAVDRVERIDPGLMV